MRGLVCIVGDQHMPDLYKGYARAPPGAFTTILPLCVHALLAGSIPLAATFGALTLTQIYLVAVLRCAPLSSSTRRCSTRRPAQRRVRRGVQRASGPAARRRRGVLSLNASKRNVRHQVILGGPCPPRKKPSSYLDNASSAWKHVVCGWCSPQHDPELVPVRAPVRLYSSRSLVL